MIFVKITENFTMNIFIKNIRFLAFLAIAFSIAGCVTRTITIKTNPSHALVYLDEEIIGESPVTIPFTYYGTRKITIEKKDDEGKLMFKRKIVFEKIKAPIYEIFPLDFFSEIVWPREIRDDHVLTYDLEELAPIPKKELQRQVLENAEELRQRVYAPDF